MQCPRRDRGGLLSSHHTAAGRGGRNFRQEGRIERKMSSDNLKAFSVYSSDSTLCINHCTLYLFACSWSSSQLKVTLSRLTNSPCSCIIAEYWI